MTNRVEVGDVWRNNRNGYHYLIISLPENSDSPEDAPLEPMVCARNVQTGKDYVRSLRSFNGTNRLGNPRFTLLRRLDAEGKLET